MNRTEAQLAAINFDSGDVTVTASAGSGKTSVMIERFIRLVLEKKAQVKEVLAVTFTRLAAAEMKDRLAKALRSKLAKGEDSAYIKKQLEDLPAANVSTVHSFCNSVIKRYFYLVGVEPNFAIADEETCEDLKLSAMDELFDDLYEADDADFIDLLRIFVRGRKDTGLKSVVRDLYEYSQSEADDETFLTTARSYYSEEYQKIFENRLIGGYIAKLKPLIQELSDFISPLSQAGEEKFVPFISALVGEFDHFERSADETGATRFFASLGVKPRKSAKDGELSLQANERIAAFKTVFDKVKGEYEDVFGEDRSVRLSRTLESGEVLGKLVALTLAFKGRYSASKAERGVLDYGDLERYALVVLKNDEAREEISSAFKYIFVDEYQDTNGIQEEIFRLLSRNNRFIVGDVKQSIYGFRGSNPDIFAAKAESGERIDLKENFRSAKGVIDAVNRTFSRVMGETYTRAPMVYGGLYPKEQGVAEIHFVKKDAKKSSVDDPLVGVYGIQKHLKSKKKEFLCGRHTLVRKLIEENLGTAYYDRGGVRRTIGFKDIMVVSRTNSYDDIVAELVKCGIPVSSESETPLAEYYEINLAADILSSVYTLAKEDSALVSVLKSGVVGLKDADLLRIRKADAESDFHVAVKRYAETGTDALAEKLREFYDYLGRIKLLSAAEGAGRLLRRVVKEKRLDIEILSMPCGKARLDRLDRFLSTLGTGADELTLGDFISKRALVMQRTTAAITSGADAVRLMTIHKSKGLEAPIVIVVGLNYRINGGHLKERIYKNRKYGLGLDHYDTENKVRRPTVVKRFIASENVRASELEEARLMYVAMTRAEVKLLMVTDSPLKDVNGQPSCLLDFLSRDDMPYIEREREEVLNAARLDERQVVLPPPDEETKNAIARALAYRYPFESDVTLSLKRTVTEVNSAFEADDEPSRFVEPMFYDRGDVEHGNAYHKFMELCSFDPEKIGADLEKMAALGALGAEEIALLDREKLKTILSLSLFERLKDHDKYREKPFIVDIEPCLADEVGTDKILLQGVIDLLAVKGDTAVVVDYKFSAKGDTALAERYRKQLDLYAYAVEKVTGLKVVGKYLVNLKSSSVVTLD